MRVHISNNETNISGFENIKLTKNGVDLSNIIDNSCLEIVAPNAIDKVDYEKIDPFISQLISKLRLNGTLFLSGVDVDIIARRILTGSIDEQEVNSIISSSVSMMGLNSVVNLIVSKGLKINSACIKGNTYEISAIRQ